MSVKLSGVLSGAAHPNHIRLMLHPNDGAFVDVPAEKILNRNEDWSTPGAVSLEVEDDALLHFGKAISANIEAKFLSGAMKGRYEGEVSPSLPSRASRDEATGIVCTFGCCSSTTVTNFGCGDSRGCCECTVGTDQTVTCYTC